MTAPIYATAAEYTAATGGGVVTDALLAQASGIIDELLIGAVYVVDEGTQIATDTATAELIRDATIAQAQWMDALGDTTGVGDTREVESASVGSVSFSGARRTSTVAYTSSGRAIAPGAVSILRVGGLLPVGVIVNG